MGYRAAGHTGLGLTTPAVSAWVKTAASAPAAGVPREEPLTSLAHRPVCPHAA